jgi:hypothetical protein
MKPNHIAGIMMFSLLAAIVHAAPVEIIGYENGGGLAFQGGTVSNYFCIEYATSLNGPWTNWGSLSEQPITGAVMVAAGPMFFRVRSTDGETMPRYALVDHGHDSVPYAMDADQVDGLHASEIAAGAALPSGVIAMWSGLTTNIPSGWALCDGNNGTPDLRDRFVVGASQNDQGVAKTTVSGSPALAGGEAFHTLTLTEMPAHTHSVQVFPDPIGGGNGSDLRRGVYTGQTGSTGDGLPHNNLPPYYAIVFIMKL